MKKYINITASLEFWDVYTQTFIFRNYKKIRLCNKADFENVGNSEVFEEN